MSLIRRRLAAASVLTALTLAACGSPSGTGAGSDDVHYLWKAGDCLLVEAPEALPQEAVGAGVVVDCERQHAYEVFATSEIAGGAGEPYPDDLPLRTWETCAAGFRDYVGAHLSETALAIRVVLPDAALWEGGGRHLACLLEDPRPGGDPPLVSGSLRGAADRVAGTVAAGQCFAARSALGPTLPCGEPHLAEAIGRFTISEAEGAPWPGSEEVRRAANDGCTMVLAGYAGAGGNAVPVTVIAFARPLSRVEWEDGLRAVDCAALAFDTDRHHVEVVGSLSDDDWWVIGAGRAA